MNVLSLFDGKAGAYAALKLAGFQIDKYFASEVDPYPMKIAKKNFPDIIHIGDVKGIFVNEFWGDCKDDDLITGEKYTHINKNLKIDLLIGGSPCQDLSIAKKNGKGLEGEKSKLFYEFVRILNEVKPKYFLMENVASMKRADEAKITEILGVKPIMINSNLVSAQNRKRLYWVGKLNESGTYDTVDIPQPEDEGILLRDVLEDIPMDDERWKPIPEKYITEDFNVRIREATKLGYVEPKVGDAVDMSQENSKTRRGRLMQGGGKSNALLTGNNIMVIGINQIPRGKNNGNIHTEKSPTVTANEFEHNNKVIAQNDLIYVWRKLTVRECARLQTIPDSFIFPVSDSRAYKAIGNGWTVKVIAHILSFIVKKR